MSIEHLLVGVAKGKITPKLGCELAGFDARKGVASGIHDDLFARALVIGDRDKAVALVSLDLIGIPQQFTNAVRKEVHSSTGIAERDIILSATHTHCGPVTIKHFFNGDQDLDVEYMNGLQLVVVETIKEAFARREPAILKSGLVPVSGVASNRRTEDGKPIDGYAGVILAEDLGGRVQSILVNYPCHPTVLGPNTLEVTRDFPHYFIERMNEHFGDGATPIYFNGTEGDISIGHKSYLSAVGIIAPFRTFEKAKQVGTQLAQCVIDSVDTLIAEAPDLSSEHTIISLPLKQYAPREEMKRAKEDAFKALGELDEQATQDELIVRRQDWLFARIEDYYSSLYEETKAPHVLPVEVSVVRVGDTAIVSLPGEVFVEIGLAIRQNSPFPRTMMIGLANDYIGYVPTVEQAVMSGYEVIASRVTPEASLVLERGTVDLLKRSRATQR
ncbi:MAG: neutral/alkaline non-lysosomal ceramidase N-terminal domain-containing protein [Edaphobacter sp.]